MTQVHDMILLETMAAHMPMSSSFVRQNRWEAAVSETLFTHVCKEDEDGKLNDDNDHVSELDAHGITDDGRHMRQIFEQLDEQIGGPLYPTNRKGEVDWEEHKFRMAQHKAWQSILNGEGLSMSAGKLRQPQHNTPQPSTALDGQEDVQPLLEEIVNGFGRATPISIRTRITSAYRIDRIITHTRGVTVDETTQTWTFAGHSITE
jgi:hypothetical protein